jgi:hypothetical protein
MRKNNIFQRSVNAAFCIATAQHRTARFETDLEGSSGDLTEVLSYNLPGGTVENHENLSQVNLCPGRDSKQVPPEYLSF